MTFPTILNYISPFFVLWDHFSLSSDKKKFNLLSFSVYPVLILLIVTEYCRHYLAWTISLLLWPTGFMLQFLLEEKKNCIYFILFLHSWELRFKQESKLRLRFWIVRWKETYKQRALSTLVPLVFYWSIYLLFILPFYLSFGSIHTTEKSG